MNIKIFKLGMTIVMHFNVFFPVNPIIKMQISDYSMRGQLKMS
jgi:hypothetical protein